MPYKVAIPLWISLGMYRGIIYYNYSHKKDCKKCEKYNQLNPEYFYSMSIFFGFIGGIVYINPLSFPFMISKEIYRLEVNIRNLDKEKETDNYYQLF